MVQKLKNKIEEDEEPSDFDPMKATMTLITRKRLRDFKQQIIEGFKNMTEDELAKESAYYVPETKQVCLFGGLMKFIHPEIFKNDPYTFDRMACNHGLDIETFKEPHDMEILRKLDTDLSTIHNQYENNHDEYPGSTWDDRDDAIPFKELIDLAIEKVEEEIQ